MVLPHEPSHPKSCQSFPLHQPARLRFPGAIHSTSTFNVLVSPHSPCATKEASPSPGTETAPSSSLFRGPTGCKSPQGSHYAVFKRVTDTRNKHKKGSGFINGSFVTGFERETQAAPRTPEGGGMDFNVSGGRAAGPGGTGRGCGCAGDTVFLSHQEGSPRHSKPRSLP